MHWYIFTEELQMSINSRETNHGITMIELLVAVTIAAIVTALAFTLYTATTGTFFRQNRYADTMTNAVRTKKQIDAAFGNIAVIIRKNDHELQVRPINSDTSYTFGVCGAALMRNSDTIAAPFESFTFSYVENRSSHDDHTIVVLWEGVLNPKKTWIGGSFVVAE